MKKEQNTDKPQKKAWSIAIVMWRFSIVIYIPITLLMMLTIMPMRWLLTGKYRFKEKELPIFYKWAKLIGF